MPEITQITRLRFVNAYLVDEDDGLTLIDTMVPNSASVALAAAGGLGRPIVRIALTHAHGDHIGSLDELAKQLPSAEVAISTRGARLLAGDKSLDPGEPDDKLRGSYPGAKTKPGRLLEPGDRVGSLEVVAAPGHTPGHVAFLDSRDRTLYCGDAYTSWGGVVATTAQTNPRFPLATMATWHKPTEVETARALRALDPSRLAPGTARSSTRPARRWIVRSRRCRRLRRCPKAPPAPAGTRSRSRAHARRRRDTPCSLARAVSAQSDPKRPYGRQIILPARRRRLRPGWSHEGYSSCGPMTLKPNRSLASVAATSGSGCC
jgi:glyoxylase-like metal-dependent hydrolase (beta-lactamase superfamily II)